MKANELMIGDWVECTYWVPSKQLKVAEIRRIMDDETKIGVYSDDLILIFRQTEVKPIPLTAEILEKNGFKKIREGRFLLENLEDNYWVKFYPKDANYTGGFYDYIDLDSGCISIREMPIEFVHELQHALRLCGIKKEIVL